MVNVNDFTGLSDNDRIEQAIAARGADGVVVLPPRRADTEPERDCWLLDRAILLPENTTFILQNSTVKLSDRCRDNFFRTANCGLGLENPPVIRNVHLRGEGAATLMGADHPRSTGDGSKVLACPCPYEVDDLCAMADWIPPERRTPETIDFMDRHDHSYGTDAGKPGESQYGDWRNIGVLFANAVDFSVSGLFISQSHCWAISLEECSFGRVDNIRFDACMSRVIDGFRNNIENQDGLDLRNGCHDIIIENITGMTGDDVVALTAIAGPDYHPGGSLCSTQVMHTDWSRRCRDIYNIVIRNVVARSELCLLLRLLPAWAHIYNVVADGLIDTTPVGHPHWATVGLGDGTYGENPVDGMRSIVLDHVICNGSIGITVAAYLSDSVISHVVNRNPDAPLLEVAQTDGLKNVSIDGLVDVGKN